MNFQDPVKAVLYTNLKEYEENLEISHAVCCMGLPDEEHVITN
jgi:hypothetical protein